MVFQLPLLLRQSILTGAAKGSTGMFWLHHSEEVTVAGA